MASLAEQLRSLTNPEPSRFDLDEDEFDLTRAQVINKERDLEEIKGQNNANTSVLRKKTVPLLEDGDKKYAGRKISRAQLEASRSHVGGPDSAEKSDMESESEGEVQNEKGMSEEEDMLQDSDEDLNNDDDDDDHDVYNEHDDVDDSGGDDNEHDDVDDSGDDTKESYLMKADRYGANDNFHNEKDNDHSDLNNEDDVDNDEGSDDGDDDDIDDDNDDDDDDDDGEQDENADENAFQSFSTASLTEDVEKGKAAKNQLSLWDNFLEMRIRLQKALLIASRLPHQDQMAEFNLSGDKNLKEVYKQGRKSVAKLLGNLLWIQEKLLEQNPDTANILHPGVDNKSAARNSDDDDEEIPSDTEDEKSDVGDEDNATDEGRSNSEQAENSLKLPAKRKHEMATQEYADYISKRHTAFKSYRDATISKWSEKTRLASGKLNSKSFSSFDRSALAQINHILSDRDRLIKRTQLKRTSYRVLGKSEDDEKQAMQSNEEQSDIHLRDYDPEIFDDDDFYHQLLREFIEQKASGSTENPMEMGRQWLELQKLRRKVKKKVDTKASKGRKIRYDVHGKLVSFMAPIEKGIMPDSSRNELFSSLFGAKQQEQAADINVFR